MRNSCETIWPRSRTYCSSRISRAGGFSSSIALQREPIMFCAWPTLSTTSHLLSVLPSHMYWAAASLPFVHGGVGLRSAEVTTRAAFWSSWADCMPMMNARDSAVTTLVIHSSLTETVDSMWPVWQRVSSNSDERGLRLPVGFGPWLASRGTTRGRANRGCGTRVAT